MGRLVLRMARLVCIDLRARSLNDPSNAPYFNTWDGKQAGRCADAVLVASARAQAVREGGPESGQLVPIATHPTPRARRLADRKKVVHEVFPGRSIARLRFEGVVVGIGGNFLGRR